MHRLDTGTKTASADCRKKRRYGDSLLDDAVTLQHGGIVLRERRVRQFRRAETSAHIADDALRNVANDFREVLARQKQSKKAKEDRKPSSFQTPLVD